MKNRKGTTLIEIIIALAVIGIIAVSFLSGFSSVFSMMGTTSELTQEVFKAQQDIELTVQDLKNEIREGNTPAGQTDYVLFAGTAHERTVPGYPIQQDIGNGRMIYTIVADGRMPEFAVASVTNLEIFFHSGGEIPHAYTNTANLSVRSRNLVLNDPHNVNLINLQRWYVSREGFNIPAIDNPEEPEIGTKYPRFPDDYAIISGQNMGNLTAILDGYAGRHIIHTVTPASVSGRMGKEVPSNPVFLSGLPVISGLRLHLDASFISKEDNTQVRTVNPTEIYARRWQDLSPSNNHAEQSTNSAQPLLTEDLYNIDMNHWGKHVGGSAGDFMQTGSFSGNTVNDMTVFVVARVEQNHSAGTTLVTGDGGQWAFGWAGSSQLGFIRQGEIVSQTKSPDFNWHVFTGSLTPDNLGFRIDGNEVNAATSGGLPPVPMGPVRINMQDGVRIGEIIIFNRAVTGSDLDQVEEYLLRKYNPESESLSIVSLGNMNASLVVGDSFTLPDTVTANMSNGTTQQVQVIWSPVSIDTSTPGLKISTGTAVPDPTKSMTYSVNVRELDVFTITFIDYDGNILKTEQVLEREDATPPGDPERTGYTFTGWSPSYTYVTSDLTVQAQYDVNKYTVLFQRDPGDVIETQQVSHGENATAPSDPVKTGYSFSGWDVSFTDVQSDLIVTAKWTPNVYNVTFNRQGGTGGATSKPVTFGGSYGSLPSPTRTGYSFNGWWTTETSGGTQIIPTTTVTTASDHTLYARWTSSGPSCPFVYAFDGTQYHLEHESIPFAINKALETTSYSALQNLTEVNGQYHVRITEELPEISFINGFKLSVVDYPKGADVQSVMVDIFGKPYTIKEKIEPIEFVDQQGNSRLDELKNRGTMVPFFLDREDGGEKDPVVSYVATFESPQGSADEAKLMVYAQKTMLTTKLGEYYLSRIQAKENMWWIESILGTPSFKEKFENFIDVINLRVELWDGEKWVSQGEIKAGLHMLEEFLVPLDLTIRKNAEEDILVRLRSGNGLFEIDQLTIDFSPNEVTAIRTVKPDSATFNNAIDVEESLADFNNGNRVRMVTGDTIDIAYTAPALMDAYERGFMIALKGYYYMDPNTHEVPAGLPWAEESEMEEIMSEVMTHPDVDIQTAMKALGWLDQIMESVYNEPFETKIRIVLFENYLNQISNFLVE